MQTGTHDYGTPAGGFPDYTDPTDMRRVRPVTSPDGWTMDRDDTDGARMRELITAMDALCQDWHGQGVNVQEWGNEVVSTWATLREALKGGK